MSQATIQKPMYHQSKHMGDELTPTPPSKKGGQKNPEPAQALKQFSLRKLRTIQSNSVNNSSLYAMQETNEALFSQREAAEYLHDQTNRPPSIDYLEGHSSILMVLLF